MSLSLFIILLFAAMMHACWNAIVKSAVDKLYSAISVTSFAALISLLLLPFVAQPAPSSYKFLVISCFFQIIYTVMVAKTYHYSDMSQTYPLMRGTAPLLVALFSVFILGDQLSDTAWLGIIVISIAILIMAFNSRNSSRLGIVLALSNACVIAGYTLIDGSGVRESQTALGYTLWTFFLNGTCLFSWAIFTHRREVSRYLIRHWKKGLIGGACTLGSYGLALWAMTQAPLAVVAALRETSILFGALIALFVLKEKLSGIRIIAACGIATGAILLRLM